MKKLLVASLALALAGGAAAQAPQTLKVGFVVAQSGALGLPGAEQRRGLEIALEHLGNKIGGLPVEIVYGDSKTNPGATVQELSRVLAKESVHALGRLTRSQQR